MRVALRRLVHHCVAHPLVGVGELVLAVGQVLYGVGDVLHAMTDPTAPEPGGRGDL